MGGWQLRLTWGQEVCYASLHSEPVYALGLPPVWSLWGNPGMARWWEMSNLPAGYILLPKVTSASSSGPLGFIMCVKCCRMVDSEPRWQLPLSWPLGREHSQARPQYIPGKQVLVRSWLWKILSVHTMIRKLNPVDNFQRHWKLTMQIASSSTQHYPQSSTFLWSLFIQSPIMIKCNLYFIVFFIEKGQKRLLYDFLKFLQTFKTFFK